MKLFIFACENWRNIETGYAAKLWATSMMDSIPASRARWSKAEKMPRFARGLIYCTANGDFTMPFVTTGHVEDRVVEDVWREKWEFPFKIQPLGSPWKQIHKEVAKREWPLLSMHRNMTCCVNGLHGVSAFVPNEIELRQWQQILADLGEESDTFPPEETALQLLLDSL